jgi:hypothetical protein
LYPAERLPSCAAFAAFFSINLSDIGARIIKYGVRAVR